MYPHYQLREVCDKGYLFQFTTLFHMWFNCSLCENVLNEVYNIGRYGFGFRGGRKYTLNRIRKQQQRLLNPPTPSRLSQVFQKRHVKNSVEKSLEPVKRSSEVATQPLEASGIPNSVSK